MSHDICTNDLRLKVSSAIPRPGVSRGQAKKVAELFGLSGPRAPSVLYQDFEFTLKPGEITAVIGPSGSGKSVLLELACRKIPDALTLPLAKLSKSSLPPVALLRGDLTHRLDVLSRCGLAEALVMITPAKRLSGGQLYRLALAWALDEALSRSRTTVLVADEFASCLDRMTAQNLCAQMRKAVSSSKLSLLLATPRTDVLEYLQPDQTIVKPLAQPPRIVERAFASGMEEHGRDARVTHGQDARATGLATGLDWPVERGSIADYRQLCQFHYIAGPPAAHKRVYVIRPGESGRDLVAPPVAAVLVVSPPVMCVRGRNIATNGRYLPGSHFVGRCQSARRAIARLNAEMECISRVIVHPAYRGLGLAVSLVKHALADARTPLMEALAVMGRINPFFEKGGMTFTGVTKGVRLYSYYIAHTGLQHRVVDWLWERERQIRNPNLEIRNEHQIRNPKRVPRRPVPPA